MGYITYTDDYVYASSFAGHQIYRMDEEEVMLFAGTGAEGNADGDAMNATFSSPNGIAHSPSGDTLLITHGDRIRMITNLDGSVSTHEINTIQEISLNPNPTHEKLNLSFVIPNSEKLKWSIADVKGQVVLDSTYKSYSLGQHNLTIDINELKAGNYWLSIINKNAQRQTIPFVKI